MASGITGRPAGVPAGKQVLGPPAHKASVLLIESSSQTLVVSSLHLILSGVFSHGR